MDFTKKEKEVLNELMLGKQNSEIADSLNVSVNTVKTHLSRMYSKTKSKGRTDLILKRISFEDSAEHLENE